MINFARRAFIFGASAAVVVPVRSWYVMPKMEIVKSGMAFAEFEALVRMISEDRRRQMEQFAAAMMPYMPSVADLDRWAQLNSPRFDLGKDA